MKFTIKLNKQEDAAIISQIAENYDTGIDFRSYDNHYVIDAKSIMGILSLDLSKPIIVDIENPDTYESFKSRVEKYIVKQVRFYE